VQEQSYRFGKIGSANGPNAMIPAKNRFVIKTHGGALGPKSAMEPILIKL